MFLLLTSDIIFVVAAWTKHWQWPVLLWSSLWWNWKVSSCTFLDMCIAGALSKLYLVTLLVACRHITGMQVCKKIWEEWKIDNDKYCSDKCCTYTALLLILYMYIYIYIYILLIILKKNILFTDFRWIIQSFSQRL